MRQIETDKLLHFGISAAAAFVVSLLTSFTGFWTAALCGSLFTLGLGLGKEYGDSKASGNYWSWRDIIADVAGIIAGAGLYLLGRWLCTGGK